jgi:outer membrane protein TolC
MDSLDLAERQEKLTREEIRAGASPTSALNAVTYEIASREEAKLRAQTEFEAKSLELRRKAGLELTDRSLVIRPGEPFSVGKQEFEIGEMLERSRQTNRRLVLLALKKRNANVDVDVAKNQMLPQLDLNLSAGLMGTGVSSDEAFSNASGANGYQVMQPDVPVGAVGRGGCAQAALTAARRSRSSASTSSVRSTPRSRRPCSS